MSGKVSISADQEITLVLPAAMAADIVILLGKQSIESGFGPHHAEVTRQITAQVQLAPAAVPGSN